MSLDNNKKEEKKIEKEVKSKVSDKNKLVQIKAKVKSVKGDKINFSLPDVGQTENKEEKK